MGLFSKLRAPEPEQVALEEGRAYWIVYECRDIGYGVETGADWFVYAGMESLAGKLEFVPADGGSIFLFDDEITSIFGSDTED